MSSDTRIVVNAKSHEVPAAAGTLLTWLREDLGLTGAKPGCGEGACGACTVLLDGNAVLACQVQLSAALGCSVTTVEGLSVGDHLHPAQEALLEEHAFQCGYCTPGMALRLSALLARHPEPDTGQIVSALEPDICRCGGYPAIVRSAFRAAELARAGESADRRPEPGGSPAGPIPLLVRRPWDMCAADEREYFDVLGPGFAFVWPGPGAVPLQRAAGTVPLERAAGGEAWMHLAPDGRITAFSGKVDVGQGNCTALRMLLAEEFDVDLTRIGLVQGDTDTCPYDIGTFGSRSLPDSGEALRRLGAGARQFLITRAATTWGLRAEDITTATGKVISRSGHRSIEYGRLAAGGEELVVLSHEPLLRSPEERRLVGRRGHRPRRIEVVTGELRFGSDRQIPGMLHGAVLRPPVPGAVLVSVDTTPAEAMTGITVVRSGQLVAALAGSLAEAQAAVGVMRAEWSEPDLPRSDLETYLRAHPLAGEGWDGLVDEATGDVDQAFSGAETCFNATYTTDFIAHVALETSSATAAWESGRVTCQVGTQTPFRARTRVAEACGVGEADVRVLVPPTGGAFGGKHGGDIAAEAAILARAAGRAVRIHWSRAEEFSAGYLRPMAVIDVRAVVDDDHSITAWDHEVINAGNAGLVPPYRTAARRLRAQPARSPVRQGSYRALGATANNFARESAMDELAFSAGVDPLDFRLRHIDDERLVAVLRRAADHFGWGSPSAGHPAGQPGERHGRGLAVGLEKGGRVATCAEVIVDSAGHIVPIRLVTAYECGTIVDPDTVRSQIEGATIMALGGALREAVPLVDGRPAVTWLSAYPVPRFGDVPDIEVIMVDRPDLPSAGAGETPMIAVAPAVANAVFGASGRRRRHLPLDPLAGHR